MLDATVILINYRTETQLIAALRHLSASPEEMPARLIVVDNSPSAYLAEKMALLFPHVKYIPSPDNLGFAGGVNLGLKQARGKFMILLNPDARPKPGCLSGLTAVLAARPEAGAAGPRLTPFTSAEPLCPSATWRDPTLLAAFVEYTPFRRVFNDRWLWDRYWVDPVATRHMTSCAMVQGACLVIEKSWLERVGDFDADNFFLYFEETDFCRRLRLKRGIVLYCPEFECRHQGGGSLEGRRQDTALFWSSFYNFHAKHHGPLYALLLRGLLTVGLACEYLLCASKRRLNRYNSDAELDKYLKLVAERLNCHVGKLRNGP